MTLEIPDLSVFCQDAYIIIRDRRTGSAEDVGTVCEESVDDLVVWPQNKESLEGMRYSHCRQDNQLVWTDSGVAESLDTSTVHEFGLVRDILTYYGSLSKIERL